jgi:hypothetical protein
LGISNGIPVGVVASLDKGRLLERDLIEANRAHPAIHHPVAAAAPGARSRRLVEGEGGGRADESLGGGRGGSGGHVGGERGSAEERTEKDGSGADVRRRGEIGDFERDTSRRGRIP